MPGHQDGKGIPPDRLAAADEIVDGIDEAAIERALG